MNWELIISAIVGMLTGGGVSWLFKIKEDKAGSKADVVDSSTEAMNKMMTLIGTQQERSVSYTHLDVYKRQVCNQFPAPG